MLKQFFTSSVASVDTKDTPKEKSTVELIEEIHDTFYTEVDRLLAEAKISNSLETDKQALIDKCKRLKALGFTNTKEVQDGQDEIWRLMQLEKENEKKQGLIEAINYFSFKYPHYKFITEQSVKRICEKYGLVYGEISRYIGTVPDKNLKHIEDFKIDQSDECYLRVGQMRRHRFSESAEFINKALFDHYNEKEAKEREDAYLLNVRGEVFHSTRKLPLEIAAPLSDFNMQDHEVRDFKISKKQVPDPIVLKPVYFEKEKHYLIVTAWGIEAEDADVLNQNHN